MSEIENYFYHQELKTKLPDYNYKPLKASYIVLFILHVCNFVMLYSVSARYFDQFIAINDSIQILHISCLAINMGINLGCSLVFILFY